MVLTRTLEKDYTGQFLTIYVFGVFGEGFWCSKDTPLTCASWATFFDFVSLFCIFDHFL